MIKNIQAGRLICEGKIRKIYSALEDPTLVIIASKDRTMMHYKAEIVLHGTGILANTITCNVFRLLKEHGVPLAFLEQLSGTSFLARRCWMFPLTVVVRREAHGSYLVRHPNLKECHFFESPRVEYFLKTKNRRLGRYHLPRDGLLVVPNPKFGLIHLFDPETPQAFQKNTFTALPAREVTGLFPAQILEEITQKALAAFSVLEDAWRREGGKLVDLTLEFGADPKNTLVLVDGIDSGSWTVIHDDDLTRKLEGANNGGMTTYMMTHEYVRLASVTSRFSAHYEKKHAVERENGKTGT